MKRIYLTSACSSHVRRRDNGSLNSNTETIDSLTFHIEDPAHPDRPRYYHVRVLDEAGADVWRIRTEPVSYDFSEALLVYGEVPEGFTDNEPAHELETGATYTVVVHGPGRGELTFAVDEAGDVFSE